MSFVVAVAKAAAPAQAADVEEQTEVDAEELCEATPSLEEARLITGRDFYARAGALYDEMDYLGAARAWEQVVILMPEKEEDLRVQLAHAYHYAFSDDEDPEHLRKAQTLFRAQLDSLAADDPTRRDIESELSKVDAELDALAKAEAEEQTRREEAIRQEQLLLNKQALAEAEAKSQRKLQKVYFGVGGSAAGVGVGSLAAMTAFLVSGARLESEGQATSESVGVPAGYYRDQLARGVSQNRAAWTTGVVGGVLTVSGGALLVVAGIRQKRLGLRRSKVALHPSVGGVELRF